MTPYLIAFFAGFIVGVIALAIYIHGKDEGVL